MKKLLRVTLYLFFVGAVIIVVMHSCMLAYKKQHDTIAEDMIRQAIRIVNDYQLSTGHYPNTLEDLPNFQEIQQKILVIFPTPEINYDLINGNYRIYYHKFPLGPFYGYDSKTKSWYTEL